MTFTKNADANGSSLQGYVHTTYSRLVEVFGKPDRRVGDKTTAEWCLEFDDGTVATIYDWKEEETPTGEYRWHVGGFDYRAIQRVADQLK